MAECYHDNQDFKSDLNIEVAREGDILKEGQDLKDMKCDKNPGHRDFIPFKDLTLDDLPIKLRTKKTFDRIKNTGKIVVRLVVDKKKLGSGCVNKYNGEYLIKTNNHVVKTDDDVKRCTVEFHYDDDSRSSVLTSRGVKLGWTCPYRDVTLFKFHPIPDFLHQVNWESFDIIPPSIVIMYKNNQIVTERTDMFTRSKYSSFQNLNSSLNYLMFISNPDSSYSYLKSFYFKFLPIPSNIQHLTSIPIHMVEDDGNRRVIPGDVVKFGDEFVVKISESIFQDEVKKYRLVWNGEVIGRGTRLYFQQVHVREFFSGMDLEDAKKYGGENLWFFDFHPIPRNVKDSSQSKTLINMCCIGHPHGGIKMITFGQYLGIDKERFDTKYQRITKQGQDCKCKDVGCLKYSCKTCMGSSGSPIFELTENADFISNFVHFMGGSVIRHLSNGEWIENVNMAWSPTVKSWNKTTK